MSSKSSYYSIIIKTLKKYNLTLQQYKENPICLFVKDQNYRNYVYKSFKPHKGITWYGKQYIWAKHIPDSIKETIERENFEWFLNLEHNKDFENNFDDSDVSTEAPSNQPSETEISADRHKESTSELSGSSKASTSGQQSTSTAEDTNKKRPGDQQGEPAKRTKSNEPADEAIGGTVNVATSIKGTSGPKQANPTGEGEVDQQPDGHQLQTQRGNLPNQRGTLQGEAGNLKIQKPLEKYGIVKVNLTLLKSEMAQNKVYIFITDNKTLANDLVEIMEDTYENGDIVTAFIAEPVNPLEHEREDYESLNGYVYIVAWKLPFNISYATLALKLGTRYNHVYTFTKMIPDFNDEDVPNLIKRSVIIKFKNAVQLLKLSEAATKCQEDQLKYRQPMEKKRKLADRF